ncbi:MAG: P63C domain-containing protein [Gracilimonas sp.]|uniref:P63C domain-containing protein n=1 Tax=Gracilimonas sp. TaxID=1974203 RepID=UPI0037513AA6|nr:P63C domain-containing protein [Gracilimonas sp.]
MNNEPISKAISEGKANINGVVLPCAVLEGGERVFNRTEFMHAIGRKGKAKGGRKYDAEFEVPVFISAQNLQPFITEELLNNSKPIQFIPDDGGLLQIGYRVELLPEVCNVFIDAKEAGVLKPNQEHIAEQCKILARGFQTIGIIALVDEATGYQDLRARDALEQLLEKYLTEHKLKWAKRFPDDFYKQMFRLKGWQYSSLGFSKRPGVAGKYTNDIVYERLAPKVLDELEKLNPKINGHRKDRHHQYLTEDFGHPKLKEHITGVIALMKASPNWKSFQRLLQRVYPKWDDQLDMFYEKIRE